MFVAPFVASFTLTLYPPRGPSPRPARAALGRRPHAEPRNSGIRLESVRSSDLYAGRARRRMAALLRMRLLELRKAGLDRAAEVIEHRLPLERLLER